jgi:hypothetical protein
MPIDVIKWTCWNCKEENESESERVVFMEMMTVEKLSQQLADLPKTKLKVFDCGHCGKPNKVKVPA